jgi:hypothetical protein
MFMVLSLGSTDTVTNYIKDKTALPPVISSGSIMVSDDIDRAVKELAPTAP